MEDYSNFSEEAREKDIRKMLDDLKVKYGATEEDAQAALAMSAARIMQINMLEN